MTRNPPNTSENTLIFRRADKVRTVSLLIEAMMTAQATNQAYGDVEQ
jgi:hypothetical protein